MQNYEAKKFITQFFNQLDKIKWIHYTKSDFKFFIKYIFVQTSQKIT